jgi:alkane 1-monooxygenase
MAAGSKLAHAAAIAARFVPHAVAAVVVMRAFVGVPYPFWPVGWLFLAVPPLELLIGEDRRARRQPGRVERAACRLAPWLWLPLHAALLIAGISMLREMPDLTAAARLAIPVGMLSGMFGMAAAHEFMHARERASRGAAALLLASCGYGHFLIEHVSGHHRFVGTPADAATARLGESVYAFLPRTVVGGLRSAWRIEAERLSRLGRRVLGPRNRLLALGTLSLLLCALAGLVAGFAGTVFLVLQGAVSVASLEVMNYIQHYGLERREAAPGVRGPLTAALTWDCAFRLTNLLLLDLGYHSDHHLQAARRFDELEQRPDAPRMPAGYFTMFVLALLPPLWAQIMDPRAALVHAQVDRRQVPLLPRLPIKPRVP